MWDASEKCKRVHGDQTQTQHNTTHNQETIKRERMMEGGEKKNRKKGKNILLITDYSYEGHLALALTLKSCTTEQ